MDGQNSKKRVDRRYKKGGNDMRLSFIKGFSGVLMVTTTVVGLHGLRSSERGHSGREATLVSRSQDWPEVPHTHHDDFRYQYLGERNPMAVSSAGVNIFVTDAVPLTEVGSVRLIG